MPIVSYSAICIIALLAVATAPLIRPAAGADTKQVLLNQDQAMPSDIDPQSGFRLPLPKREELDEAGRAAYDRAVTPGRTIAGLQGPAGVQLYSPKIAPHVSAINQYLRYEAGYPPRVREVAILTTAREMDSQFEWVAHEPEALKVGVPAAVIDVIKYRRDPGGLDAADAAVIELGRALWRDHKVSPDLFARAKTLFGPPHPDRLGAADGELCRNCSPAFRSGHAAPSRQTAIIAHSIGKFDHECPPSAKARQKCANFLNERLDAALVALFL